MRRTVRTAFIWTTACSDRYRACASRPGHDLLRAAVDTVHLHHPIVAGEAWIDAGQDHGDVGELMPDDQAYHGVQIADGGRANFQALGLVCAVALDEVEHLAARCFEANDRLTSRDTARHMRAKLTIRQAIQNPADHVDALEQLLDAHLKTRLQIAARSRAPS